MPTTRQPGQGRAGRDLRRARHQQAEERCRLSLEAGRMGTWSVDPDTGVTVMDDRFASLFGAAHDVAGEGASLEHFIRIIHPDDRASVIAARRLRAQPETADAVLIAVTGYGQEHDREATRVAGFDHHLVKPFDTGHLMTLLAGVAPARP